MNGSTMKHVLLCACGALVACFSQAAEIIWCGSHSSSYSSPSDLAEPSNWTGGVCPGADDVAVIDMAGKGITYVTLSKAMTVKGLEVRRASTPQVDFTLVGGAKLLSIGDSGVKAGNVNLSFMSVVEVLTSSAWSFSGTKKQLTSHEPLTAANADVVLTVEGVVHVIYGELKFPGVLFYRNGGSFNLQASGKMAREVKTDSTATDANTIGLKVASNEWSEVFTDGVYRQKSWAATSFGRSTKAASGIYPLFVYGEGDVFDAVRSDNGGPQYMFRISNGTFRQTGGSYVGGSFTFVGETADAPTALELFGGGYTVDSLYLGCNGPNSCVYPALVTQRAGASVTNKSALLVAARGGSAKGLSVYDMQGGSLTVNGANPADSQMHGLILSAGESGSENNGVFTQSGGEVKTSIVRFGAPKSMWGNDAGDHTDGFGLLDLAGGVFDVGTASLFAFSPKWTNNPGESSYRVSLHGGTLKTHTPYTNRVQLAFPPDKTAGTWDDQGQTVRLAAPLYGSGSFRKSGTGTMYLEDATRFTGTLEVNAGTLVLPTTGESAADIPTEGDDACFVWTADSLAATLSDGAAVESWADVNHGVAAVSNVNFGVGSYGVPSLAKNVLNGHAAVRFSRSVLTIPKQDNFLAGQSNMTFVCVLRNEGNGNGSRVRPYEWSYCHAPIGSTGKSSDGTETQLSGFALGYYDDSRYAFGVNIDGAENYKDSNVVSPVPLNDGLTHVAIGVKNGAEMSLYVDGSLVGHTILPGSGTSCNFALFTASNGSVYPKELHFGVNNLDGKATGSDGYSYQGWISEIRFYTNRVFSVAEQQQLGRCLLQKYAGADAAATLLAKNVTYSPAEHGSFAHEVETIPPPKAATALWQADDLSFSADSGVGEWRSADGTRCATAAAGHKPVLVRNSFGGHAAVRFGGTECLTLPTADSPVAGKGEFAVALVFSARADGAVSADGSYYDSAGLVSCWQGTGAGAADFALGLASYGTFTAGCGGASPVSLFRRNPCWLHDGLPHVAIMNVSSSQCMTMVDGVYAAANAVSSARGAFDLVFGAMRADGTRGFVGDIAEIRFYDVALTRAEMSALCESVAQRYAFRLAGRLPVETLTARGLAATNVIVRPGAVLRTALSSDAPYVVGAGQRLEVDGEWRGTASVEGGTIGFASVAKAGRIEDLRLSGIITLAFPEGSAAPTDRVTELFDIGTLTVAPGTVFNVTGLPGSYRVAYRDGKLVLRALKGLVVIVQ